eukprot:m.142973 g.142973  ORF g.142973 m.142973 type:complete len:225 (+) comp30284_c0_seq1:137-811(+)
MAMAQDLSGSRGLPDWTEAEHLTGTTIMAVEYDGGVVIAADSRTTTGSYIANRVTDKLTRVTDNIYCCRSGSAADTQSIADIVNYYLDVHSVQIGEAPKVATAAAVFKKMCYENRDKISAGIIVAGYDKYKGGQVFSVPLGGMCVQCPFTVGGSGSGYVYGLCDKTYKENMTKEECIEWAKTTVALAMSRDGSSGGVIRLATIDKDGVTRHVFKGKDVPSFFEG